VFDVDKIRYRKGSTPIAERDVTFDMYLALFNATGYHLVYTTVIPSLLSPFYFTSCFTLKSFLFYPVDGDSSFLQNAGKYLPCYMAPSQEDSNV
jgi:hypothetical protein